MHTLGSTFQLEADEVKALVNGKYQTRQCTHCYGKGWFWVHEDGTQRNPESNESHDDFYEHPCGDDECSGLGFNILFDTDGES